MTGSRDIERELEELLAALDTGALTDAQRIRLNELMREDAPMRAVLDQLELDALLRWQRGAGGPSAAPVASPRPDVSGVATRARWINSALVAALVLLAAGVYWWPRREVVDASAPHVALTETWSVRATGAAEYQVTAPRELRLVRGEIHVASTRSLAGPVTITTPVGAATATGTDFYIGYHTRDPQEKNMDPELWKRSLTRVLVLAGTVTLANPLGAATGTAGELLVAPQGGEPTKVVARATNAFGYDLYRQLATTKRDANLFFSPYSIATVLTMAAAGARGETASELAHVLHLPLAGRGLGRDAQAIPVELGRFHTGHRDLREVFEGGGGRSAIDSQLQRRIADLKVGAAAAKARVLAAEKARKWRAMRIASRAEKKIIAELNAAFEAVPGHRLRVANAVWSDRGYALADALTTTLRRSYASDAIVSADFRGQPGVERQRINAWVKQRTGGKIPELVSASSVDEQTRIVLLNAVYFQAQWLEPFQVRFTKVREFTGAGGRKIRVPMMRGTLTKRVRYGAFRADGKPFASPTEMTIGQTAGLYPGAGGFQIVELPYRGSELAMVLLVPIDPGGLAGLEARVSAERMDGWLARLVARTTSVALPKFEVSTTYRLDAVLRELGAKRAFDPQRADFAGMVASTNTERPPFISGVIHKAFISVDEKGTEAAAATAVISDPGAAAPQRKLPFVPQVEADHPFLYLIRDRRTGTVLFFGRMAQPK